MSFCFSIAHYLAFVNKCFCYLGICLRGCYEVCMLIAAISFSASFRYDSSTVSLFKNSQNSWSSLVLDLVCNVNRTITKTWIPNKPPRAILNCSGRFFHFVQKMVFYPCKIRPFSQAYYVILTEIDRKAGNCDVRHTDCRTTT